MYQVGDAPTVGDRHRPPPELSAMERLGSALADLIVPSHPDFEGDGFVMRGDTNAWIHRFDDPDGWR
jgi:hypothetical protein